MLVAVVGHEVRAPLQTATIGLELLQMRVRNAADEIPHAWLLARFDQLGRAVSRLRDVADRLLDAAVVDATELTLVRTEQDLGTLVQAVVDRLGDELEWSSSSVTISRTGTHRGAWDRIHVETATQNLLTNGTKFGAGRPIAVRVEDAGDDVRVSVRDHGCGIKAYECDIVFESFFRGRTPGRVPGLGNEALAREAPRGGARRKGELRDRAGGRIDVHPHPNPPATRPGHCGRTVRRASRSRPTVKGFTSSLS